MEAGLCDRGWQLGVKCGRCRQGYVIEEAAGGYVIEGYMIEVGSYMIDGVAGSYVTGSWGLPGCMIVGAALGLLFCLWI